MIVTSISSNLHAGATSMKVASEIRRRFEDALKAALTDIKMSKKVQLAKSFISEQSDLTVKEIGSCLDFITSHMITTFQGDLAEFLSVKICVDTIDLLKREGRLPQNATLVWGGDICERSRTKHPGNWLKGADGLIVMAGKTLARQKGKRIGSGQRSKLLSVFGVVEVKSYSVEPVKVLSQFSSHVARLQHGLKIAKDVWDADQLSWSWYDALRHRIANAPIHSEAPEQLARIFVWPAQSAKKRMLQRLPGDVLIRELPCTKEVVTAASYFMTVRFMEMLGRELFAEDLTKKSKEEAGTQGFNAVKEALYQALRRDLGPSHKRIATRLYNVYGFGFEEARLHKGMIWSIHGKPESDDTKKATSSASEEGTTVDQLLDGAWSHYRGAQLEKVLPLLEMAISIGLPDNRKPRVQWLQGMVHYYSGDFAKAAMLLPHSSRRGPGGRWARDKIERITASARGGNLNQATARLKELTKAKPKDIFLQVSIPSCKALIQLLQGKADAARRNAEIANANLKSIRSMMQERDAQGLGEPRFFEASAIQEAAIDLAKVFASLGESKSSMDILERISDPFPPVLALVERDPMLENLHQHPAEQGRFHAWMQREKAKIEEKSG
jgi:hypothetical protein